MRWLRICICIVGRGLAPAVFFEDVEAEIARLGAITDGDGNTVYATREDCVEEIVANSMFDAFTNEKFVKKLMNENRSLFGRIADRIKEMLSDIKAAISMLGNTDAAVRALKDDVESLEKINTTFNSLLEKAGEKYRAEHEGGQKNNTAEAVKYSINNRFYNQLDNWDGKTEGFSFVLGNTSEALLSAGIPKKQIKLDASKLKKTIEKHTGMTIEVFKQLPQLLENPIVVIDSKQDSNSKIIMGDLYDANGKVVTAVLKLNPSSRKGNILDIIKVSSAEGRSHINSLFQYDDGTTVPIRYKDEKRIHNWLNVNRLQSPLRSTNTDSKIIIPEVKKSVKASFGNLSELKSKRDGLAEEYKAEHEDGQKNNTAEAVRKFSYDELIKKPDMKVTELTSAVPLLNDGKINRADLLAISSKNAARAGTINKQGNAVINVKDIGRDVIISKAALRHGIDRRIERQAKTLLHIGEILENSICINELDPKKENAIGSYILLGTAKTTDGNCVFVNSIVNTFTGELEDFDVLYSIDAKKESTASKEARASGDALQSLTDSTISISKLLELVKDYFPNILPQSVLSEFGISRGNGEIEKGLLYSHKDTNPVQAHWAEAIRENHHFRNIMSLIDEMQLGEGKIQLNSRDIDRIARGIIKSSSSKYDRERFSDELTVIYDYMANSGKNADTEEIYKSLLTVANGILEQSEMKDTELYDQYKNVRDFLRNQPIYITPQVKKEIEAQFGDFKSFRNILMGKVMHMTTSDSSARTLDEVWTELAEMAPEYFPKDFNEKDMPMQSHRAGVLQETPVNFAQTDGENRPPCQRGKVSAASKGDSKKICKQCVVLLPLLNPSILELSA